MEGFFCRGCYALGTACGQCDRCLEERVKLAEEFSLPEVPPHEEAIAHYRMERGDPSDADTKELREYLRERAEKDEEPLRKIGGWEREMYARMLAVGYERDFWRNKYLNARIKHEGFGYYNGHAKTT